MLLKNNFTRLIVFFCLQEFLAFLLDGLHEDLNRYKLSRFFTSDSFLEAKYLLRTRVVHRRNKKRMIWREIRKGKNKMASLTSRRFLLLINNLLRLLSKTNFKVKSKAFQSKGFWICCVYAKRQQKGEFQLPVEELILFHQEYFPSAFVCPQRYLRSFFIRQDTSFENKQQECENQLVEEKGYVFACDT